ncbi:BrnT family toxin [Bradyrhizobium diazoefficiens]|uniref:BrnT family toxin n=1 Tax=Bradyrhizobium diazoefficiens TaxID=1355477 RepID=UPI00190DCE7E|nr:BrnT family toxin [Bradyrhizobium diazoefficiens]MBK3660505.1 BrnT family toxin [Bradyrhizobium diazoefficiens]
MPDLSSLAPAGFEWDEEKGRANLAKHGVSFDDASQIFYGPIVIKPSDCADEERWIAIGEFNDQILTVIFTRRNKSIRIISARRPRPDEKRAYREASMGRSPQGKH